MQLLFTNLNILLKSNYYYGTVFDKFTILLKLNYYDFQI
jgi:hypothetical protein